MILCARSTSRSREQSTKRRSRSENMWKDLFIVKITRLYDYQTWQTHFWRNSRGCAKVHGLFFLIVLFGCWLAEQTNFDHMGHYKTQKKNAILSGQRKWHPPMNTPKSNMRSNADGEEGHWGGRGAGSAWHKDPHCWIFTPNVKCKQTTNQRLAEKRALFCMTAFTRDKYQRDWINQSEFHGRESPTMRVFVVGTAFPSFKPLAKRTRKSAQVNASFRLAFRLAIHLRWLALTSVGFGRVQIRTQVDARISPLGHPTQVDTSWSQVSCICVKFTTFCDLRELASRLANPFGQRH